LADNPKVKRPNIRQRRVAAWLKEWRKRTGRSTEDVASQLRWSPAKLNRFELATQIAGPAEIIALAAILGVDEAERDRVVTWAIKGAEGLVWWRPFTSEDAGDDFVDFMHTESEATTVWSKEGLLVPGLLQDDAYMTLLMRSWTADDDRIEARRELRRRRQARLTATADPLNLHAIIYEAAMLQPFVPPSQIDHLLAMAELPNVKVQVLPTQPESAGPGGGETKSPAPGFEASYALMKFDDEADASAVYVENLTSGLYIESSSDVGVYTLNFERLENQALDPNASARWLESLR